MNAKPPGSAHADEHPEISAANARAGLVLFFIYLAFYAGFMGLAAFAPQSMGRPALGGVNLAITYGLALIFGALLVAGTTGGFFLWEYYQKGVDAKAAIVAAQSR